MVGPSGSGKDTLLNVAREHFSGSSEVYFPKRFITRDRDAGGEDHIAVNDYRFELLRLQGHFAFYWEAHNLKYGIPEEITDCLKAGTNVVVNISRSVIDQVRQSFDNVTVISIVVSSEELEKRLHARGRESAEDIAQRLERARSFKVTGPDVVEIDNSGSVKQSCRTFIETISRPRPLIKPDRSAETSEAISF